MNDQAKALSIFATAFFLYLSVFAAQEPNFAGEYADKTFLNGQGVFQLSLEQTGKDVSVFFSAAYNNGQGAAPEADGTGHVTPKDVVEFRFQDSMRNSGTGTITRSGDDVIVSIKTSRVADPRCLVFYKQNIRLKRVKK